MGTLDFMPPEQRRDATQTDARSDLWSLAATLYQLVSGEPPRVIDLDEVPQELRTTLSKALKTKPDARYQTAREFKDALRAPGRRHNRFRNQQQIWVLVNVRNVIQGTKPVGSSAATARVVAHCESHAWPRSVVTEALPDVTQPNLPAFLRSHRRLDPRLGFPCCRPGM